MLPGLLRFPVLVQGVVQDGEVVPPGDQGGVVLGGEAALDFKAKRLSHSNI